jgi:hypothetical protein
MAMGIDCWEHLTKTPANHKAENGGREVSESVLSWCDQNWRRLCEGCEPVFLVRHRSRQARDCGALWHYDRQPPCLAARQCPQANLLNLLDDATRYNTGSRLYESETLLAHFDFLPRIFQAHGLPLALYVDYHSFFTQRQSAVGTQRQSVNALRRSTVIGCWRPDGDIDCLRHAPDPNAKPIVLLIVPSSKTSLLWFAHKSLLLKTTRQKQTDALTWKQHAVPLALMKSTTTLKFCIISTLTMTILPFVASSAAQVLLAANLTGRGVFQDSKTVNVNCRTEEGERFCDEVEVKVIKPVAINNKLLINLALGRSIKTNVPSNLILALSPGCNGDTPILGVYDKNSSNLVVNIAQIDVSEENSVEGSKVVCTGTGEERACEAVNTGFQAVATLSFQSVSKSPLNSIQGGEVKMYVKGTSGEDGCPSKVLGSGSGTVDVTVTSSARDPDTGEILDETESFHVLIQNLTLSAGKRLPVAP